MKMDKRRNYTRNAPKQKKETHMTSKKKESKKRKIGHIDYTFLTIVIIIVCTGLIMLFSASAPAANRKFDNSYYFFIRQFFFACVGFVAMIVISRIDYRKYKKYCRKHTNIRRVHAL